MQRITSANVSGSCLIVHERRVHVAKLIIHLMEGDSPEFCFIYTSQEYSFLKGKKLTGVAVNSTTPYVVVDFFL